MSISTNVSLPAGVTIKEEPITDRTIHFLIPALSADEPSHILSLPETFACQQSLLEIPLPSGKCILAPSPSQLFHYYESVQPQVNSIVSSSEAIFEHLTAGDLISIVENLSEYSITCPVLQNYTDSTTVDSSTSMVSIDDSCTFQHPNDLSGETSNQPVTEYYFGLSRSCENFYTDSTTIDDSSLLVHNDQLFPKYYSSYSHNYEVNSSSSSSNSQWTLLPTGLPVQHVSSQASDHEDMSDFAAPISDANGWKTLRLGNRKDKKKARNSRKRTKFSTADLEVLNLSFEKNPMPSRSDISILSDKLGYQRYIVQVWFYNKRQSLKRTFSFGQRLLNNESNN